MKIIKFDLPINGVKVKNIDELRDNLTDEIVTLAKSGLLVRWLKTRSLADEAQLIATAVSDTPNDKALCMEICKALSIEVFDEDLAAIFDQPPPKGTRIESSSNREQYKQLLKSSITHLKNELLKKQQELDDLRPAAQPQTTVKKTVVDISTLAVQVTTQRLWWVLDRASSTELMLYDTQSKLLWDANPKTDKVYSLNDGKTHVSRLSIANLKDWHLPSQGDLWDIAGIKCFPLHDDQQRPGRRRILGKFAWLSTDGAVDMDNNAIYASTKLGYIFCCNNMVIRKTDLQFLELCLSNQWDLVPCTDKKAQPLLHALYSTSKP